MAEKPEDLSLPASVVARIIKDALPEGVSVSKEARVAIAKAASVFILYCTACSNNLALQAKRKTLAASDVLSALSDMEFDEFTPELKSFLDVYKREQKGKREAAADRRKQKAVVAAQSVDSQPPAPTSGTSHTVTTDNSGTNTAVEATGESLSGGAAVTENIQSGDVRREEEGEGEEAMETDAVVEQLSGTVIPSVS